MSRQAQAGFTLLELLAALVVLGLLFVAIVQGVQFGLSAWQIQVRTIGEQGSLSGVDRTLRTMIERADPGGFLQRQPAFDGTTRSLSFTTVLPIGARFAQPADVMLRTDDAHRLILLWLPHYSDPIGPARIPERSVLLDGVDHIEISYWQVGSGSGGGVWRSAWNGPVLPQLVRIRIVFPAGDKRHWPDLVVAPMRAQWRV
jgi:general secretion pathway protein J